jgi:hypothetical protein
MQLMTLRKNWPEPLGQAGNLSWRRWLRYPGSGVAGREIASAGFAWMWTFHDLTNAVETVDQAP